MLIIRLHREEHSVLYGIMIISNEGLWCCCQRRLNGINRLVVLLPVSSLRVCVSVRPAVIVISSSTYQRRCCCYQCSSSGNETNMHQLFPLGQTQCEWVSEWASEWVSAYADRSSQTERSIAANIYQLAEMKTDLSVLHSCQLAVVLTEQLVVMAAVANYWRDAWKVIHRRVVRRTSSSRSIYPQLVCFDWNIN